MSKGQGELVAGLITSAMAVIAWGYFVVEVSGKLFYPALV